MRSIDERQVEIIKLATLKPKVPKFSKYPAGPQDNHHDAIDAQIWVLKENPNELGLYVRAGEQRWAEMVTDAAIEALRWLEEPDRQAPSEDWATLVPKEEEPEPPKSNGCTDRLCGATDCPTCYP